MGLDSYLHKVKKIQLEETTSSGVKITKPITPASARVIEYYYGYLNEKKSDPSLKWTKYLTSRTSYLASIPSNVDEIISQNENKSTGKLELLKEVGYFRKNYFLHTYMVKHYQRGDDNCDWSVAMDKEDLTRLLDYCRAIFKEVGKNQCEIRDLYAEWITGKQSCDMDDEFDETYKIPKFDSEIIDMVFDSDDCKNEPITPDIYNIIDMNDILEIYDVMINILADLKDDEKVYYLSWW